MRPRLREARQRHDLTQRQLAHLLGVPQPVIAVWETGQREPRVRAAVSVARALGTTVEAIWPPEPKPKRKKGGPAVVTPTAEADALIGRHLHSASHYMPDEKPAQKENSPSGPLPDEEQR